MIRQELIEIMVKNGMYSKMKICPLAYHSYKPTRENILQIIEEVDAELTLRPEHADNLLDIRNDMTKLLNDLN